MAARQAKRKIRLLTFDDLKDMGKFAEAFYESENPDGPPYSELSDSEKDSWWDGASEKMESLNWWGDD